MATKKQKNIVYALCVAFLLSTLFSIAFIIKEASHDCTGKECITCTCVHHVANTLKEFAKNKPRHSFFYAMALFYCLVVLSYKSRIFFKVSLISYKIRLDI